MLSSLRILAWRALEQGRRLLQQRSVVLSRRAPALPQPSPALPGLPSAAPQQKQSLLQRYYLVHQQALKQSIPAGNRPRGQGGGPISFDGSTSRGAVVAHAPPLSGLFGRLGPLVSGAVRRLASIRRPSSGRHLLYRDTAPLFALVGVTLAGVGEDGEDDGGESILKRRGFVTRQEELEAICCTIRDAVSRSGWLFDPESWAPYPSSRYPPKAQHLDDAANHNAGLNDDEINSNVNEDHHGKSSSTSETITATKEHVFSLQDLELDGVIDKGCNAVVYAARWKKEDSSATTASASDTTDVTLHSDTTSTTSPCHPPLQGNSPAHASTDRARSPSLSEDSSPVAAPRGQSSPRRSDRVLNHNTLVNSLSSQQMHPSLNDDNEFSYNLNDRLNLNDSFNDSITSLYHRSNNNNNEDTQRDGGLLSNVLDSNFLTHLNSSVHSFQQLPCSTSFGGNPGRQQQGVMTVLPFHGSTVSLGSQPISTKLAQDIEEDFEGEQSGLFSATSAYNNDLRNQVSRSRHLSESLAEDFLLASGGFGRLPQRSNQQRAKRVRFLAPPSSAERDAALSDDEDRSANTARASNEASIGRGNQSNSTNANASEEGPSSTTGDSRQFPLAVKLVFNYEAASNAPAILSALYRELLPARTLQLDATYDHWRRDFFGETQHCRLPAHPNIVDMPCAFVDRVPLLQGGQQLYPLALPARLHPDGLGRNMSLFCVMQRYDMSLAAYLAQYPSPPARTGTLLLAQLLEALAHLHSHNICHRDLKPDNILLSLRDGWQTPLLVLTDFGCCLAAASSSGLSVAFMSREAEPRQGNVALMAPEIKCARPGLLQSIDFSRGDIWAAGAIAYQFFGLPNPFLTHGAGPPLDSGRYREGQLPGLQRTDAPPVVARLVSDLLRRRPQARPSPSVAATLCQLALWGPSPWLNRHAFTKPKHDQVLEWLLSLTTKVLCDRRGGNSVPETEYRLVSTFLARLRYTDVLQAIAWNRAF